MSIALICLFSGGSENSEHFQILLKLCVDMNVSAFCWKNMKMLLVSVWTEHFLKRYLPLLFTVSNSSALKHAILIKFLPINPCMSIWHLELTINKNKIRFSTTSWPTNGKFRAFWTDRHFKKVTYFLTITTQNAQFKLTSCVFLSLINDNLPLVP